MSTEFVLLTPVDEEGPIRRRVGGAWARTERFLVYAGDWLNPILVKETRQALKSFQFTATFVLVLICCWIVTIGVAAAIGPSIFYAAAGGTFLLWYYSILAFPLTVIVPLAAFRSLMAEREDNTYELLSITTLKSRQIISGKLGSAVVQMGVYFSAITPCLAFTYLLRGVDLPTIAFLVGYTFLGSLGLSMFGILLATLSTKRYVHIFILVGFILMLLAMFYFAMVAAFLLVTYSYSYIGSSIFWITVTLGGTFYLTSFALAFFAAAGMITFASENRSSPLRICMLVQAAAIVGWIAYGWIEAEYRMDWVLVLAMIAGIYWYVMGTMLTAERPGMSQRVKRQLPHSALGRMFFSWLNPGPASGYMFVVANATAMAILCFLGAVLSAAIGKSRVRPSGVDEVLYLLVIGWAYLVAYLGIGLQIVRLLRRFAVVTMLACVLVNLLLLLGGFGIPYAIKSMSNVLRDADYTFLQITDPFFSILHVGSGGAIADTHKLLVIIPSVAVCVLLANLPSVIRELRVVREAAPKRVQEDEAELNPPPEVLPSNPWDEERLRVES